MSNETITKNDMMFFRDDMLSDVKKTETEINKKINSINELIGNKTTEYDTKLSKIFDKMNEFSSLIALRKHDNENIEQLLSMKSKFDDQITENKAKLNIVSKTLAKSISRYDTVITENLLVPGLIGISCKYKNCKNFFEYICKEFKSLQEYKDDQNNINKKYQDYNDNIISIIQKNIDKMGEKCTENSYLRLCQYEQKVENKFRNIEDKISEIKEENLKYVDDLLSNIKNLDTQSNNLENIKSEIYGKFFHELIKFQEEIGNINQAFKEHQNNYNILKKKLSQISESLKDNRFQKSLMSRDKTFREMGKRNNFMRKQNPDENKIGDDFVNYLKSPNIQNTKESILMNNNYKNINQYKSPVFKSKNKESVSLSKFSIDRKEINGNKTPYKNINNSINRVTKRNSIDSATTNNNILNNDNNGTVISNNKKSINNIKINKTDENLSKTKRKTGKIKLGSKLVTENNLVLNFNTKCKKVEENVENLSEESEGNYSLQSSVSMSFPINNDDNNNKEKPQKKNVVPKLNIKQIPAENDNEKKEEKIKRTIVTEKSKDYKNSKENENKKENENENKKENINNIIKNNSNVINKEQKVGQKIKEESKEKINNDIREGIQEISKEEIKEVTKESNKESNKTKINEIVKDFVKKTNEKKINKLINEDRKEICKGKINKEIDKENSKEKIKQINKENDKEKNKEEKKETTRENQEEISKEKIKGEIENNNEKNNHIKSESDKYISKKQNDSYSEKGNLSVERESNIQSKQNLLSVFPLLSNYNSIRTEREKHTENIKITESKRNNEITIPKIKINLNSDLVSNSMNNLSNKKGKIKMDENVLLSPELTNNSLNDNDLKMTSKLNSKNSKDEEENKKCDKIENVESKKYIKSDILEIKEEKNKGITFLTTINNSNNNVNNNDNIFLIKENNKSLNTKIKILEEKTDSILKQINTMYKIINSIHNYLKNKKNTIKIDNTKSLPNKGNIEPIKYNTTNIKTSRMNEVKSGFIHKKINGVGALYNIDNEFNEFNINLNGNESTSRILKKLEPFLIKQFSKNTK